MADPAETIPPGQARTPSDGMSVLRVPVGGMTCQSCASGVRTSLGQLAGVEEVRVDLERRFAEVRGEGRLDQTAVREALAAAGYEPADSEQAVGPGTGWWMAGLAVGVGVLAAGMLVFREVSATYLVGETISALNATFAAASAAAVGLAFVFGVVVAFAPSTLAVAPAVMGYVTATRTRSVRRAGMLAGAFVAGMVVVDVAIGALFALGGAAAMRALTARLPLWYGLLAVLLAGVGLVSLNVWRPRLPSFLPRPGPAGGPAGAFLAGVPAGLMACPSCTPLLLPVALGAAATGDPLYGAALMGAFAVGRGIPLVAVGSLSGAARTARRLSRWVPAIERTIGVLALAGAGWFGWAFLGAGGLGVLW